MKPTTVTREAVFDAASVRALLARAEQAGSDVELAKDDGAYLCTWNADGSPATDVIVYARGHEQPPQVPERYDPDDPWVLARNATRAVWGVDDFSEVLTAREVREALGESGLVVRTQLTVSDWPADAPADLWGRRDPIHRLAGLVLLPAVDETP